MENVLITGFEPFDGEAVNPSWEVVKLLNNQQIAGKRVVARQMPCVFGQAINSLNLAIDELHPSLIICVGQAGGIAAIHVERVAINVNDARIPDNQGQQPIDESIVVEGPTAYFATLPIKAITNELRQAGIPAVVSQTAGTYVCNHIMYGLLHRLNLEHNKIKGGFIHIPYLPEQAVSHPGAPSMAVETVRAALEKIILVSLQVEQDTKIIGGAIH